MKNKYNKYWIKNEEEWHKNQIGIYHVSSIGRDTSDFDQDKTYGPCLRQTFYKYTDPNEYSKGTKGNFRVGKEVHKMVQKIYKINHPNSITEFPLCKDEEKLRKLGSIDILQFIKNGDFKNKIDIIDIKTASSYTLPKNKWDKNPSYFAQVYIYAYIVDNFIFKDDWEINELKLVYVDKHNYSTYEIIEEYDEDKAEKIYNEFDKRCNLLHAYLRNDMLPNKEPMKWCKYCDYRKRCDNDVKHVGDIPPLTEKDLEELFEEKTGKHAYWGGKKTHSYEKFLNDYQDAHKEES